MTHEIEVKILDINVDDTIDKLVALGAKKVDEHDQHCEYYDYPDQRLKSEGKSLRIRSEGDIVKITLKYKISQELAKIMDETDVTVDDFDHARKLLTGMGMELDRQFDKHRISYELAPYHFDIDHREGIPPYLEIEAPDEDSLFKMVEKLGFKKDDAKPWTGSQVMAHYKKKR